MQPQIMTKNCALLTAITLLIFITNVACECLNVATSEGYTTLQNGQMACAPLINSETEDDKGKTFVTCDNGKVVVQKCSPGLRYDTDTNFCIWPMYATCALHGGNSVDNANKQSASTIRTQQHQPREECSANNCKLPDCFCYGDSPSSIPLADMPQFIMLTFDDSLSNLLYDTYFRALLVDNDYLLFNPSGCRFKSTLFVSHENTNYTKVKAVWNAGNEIACHTIHHHLPKGDKDSDYPQMVAEIQGLKDEMMKAIGSAALVDSIKGFRAPHLLAGGNVQYDVLRDYGFLYDSSIISVTTLQGNTPDWPYTLDFVLKRCWSPPCPTKAYPGLWEIPLIDWAGDNGVDCSMVDSCVPGQSAESATEREWYNLFNRNFHDYFYPIRTPMPFFTHGSIFTRFPNSYPALAKWLQDMLTRKDVWLVTPTQVIEWMKKPLSNGDMIDQKWGC